MTKMYVLAKCLITILGVYAVNIALRYISLPIMPVSNPDGLNGGTITLVCVYLLLCLAVYLALFRDNGFAHRLAGPAKPDEALVSAADFVKALRIAIVFAGLMLLPSAIKNSAQLISLPTILRALLFSAFGSEHFSHQLPKNGWVLVEALNSLLRLCLTAYLIIGAPAYIRWQLRKYNTTAVITGE